MTSIVIDTPRIVALPIFVVLAPICWRTLRGARMKRALIFAAWCVVNRLPRIALRIAGLLAVVVLLAAVRRFVTAVL